MTFLAPLLLLSLNMLVINRHVHVWINGHGANMSYSVISSISVQFSWLVLFTSTILTPIPFTMILIPFLLLFFPQTCFTNMQLFAKTAHLKTLKMVVNLLLYTTFFCSLSYYFVTLRGKYNNFIFTSSGICFSFSPFMCSDSREHMLKQAFLSTLWGVKYIFVQFNEKQSSP